MTDVIFDLSMTISELMYGTNVSFEDARTMASLIEAAIQRNVVDNKHDDVTTGNVRQMEKDLLRELWALGHFDHEDVRKIQQIIQACFKSYYYNEKEFTMKVAPASKYVYIVFGYFNRLRF